VYLKAETSVCFAIKLSGIFDFAEGGNSIKYHKTLVNFIFKKFNIIFSISSV